jgi:hypothetical protein
VGDPQKISLKNARVLQRRRCTRQELIDIEFIYFHFCVLTRLKTIVRLAISLTQRIELYVSGKADEAMEAWRREASVLIEASYGYELIQVIGRVSVYPSGLQFI